MLRQPRPNSQPNIQYKKDDDWSQLIDRFKSSVDQDLSLSTKESLQTSPDFLSPPSSSSSSSSLASSSISLSTNSSTSTVLAALNTMHTNRSKSMIARYSANNNPSSSSNKIQAKRPGNQASSEEDEDEDPNQALSSASSSTSSSSGLSSMNSSSNTSQEQYQQTINYSYCSEPQDEDHVNREVKECLNDLVSQVGAAEQADNEIEYTSFQLHEVVLAQTRSQTTSGSSDEDNTGVNSPSDIQTPIGLVCEAQQVTTFLLDGHSELSIIELARQSVTGICTNKQHRPLGWLVGLKPDESLIEWHQALDGSQIRSARLEQVFDCQVDRELLVWILDRSSGGDQSGAPSGGDLETMELETTLDDIALALDEPVDFSSKHDPASTREVLAWLCLNEDAANRFRDTYRAFKGGNNNSLEPEKSESLNHSQRREIQREHKSASVDGRVVGSQASRFTNDLVSTRKDQQQAQQVKSPSSSSDTKSLVRKSLKQQTKSSQSAKVVGHHQSKDGVRELQHREEKRTGVASGTPVTSSRELGAKLSAPSASPSAINNELATITPSDKINKPKNKPSNSEAVRSDRLGVIKQSDQTSSKRDNNKSASGTDPAHSSSSSTSSSALATYYRSVASKVLSNGQSKIKSFKDEMIKLNNRIPSSAGSKLSKRNSMVAQSGQIVGHNLSSSAGSNGTINNSREHQLGEASSSIGKSKIDQQGQQQQAPEVKPRTSILKNKQVIQNNNGCDNNDETNNYNTNDSTQATTVGSGKRVDTDNLSQCRPVSEKSKPKSILKTSKSISNMLYAENHLYVPSGYDDGVPEDTLGKRSQAVRSNVGSSCCDINSFAQRRHSKADDHAYYKQVSRRSDYSDKRRSVYSLAGNERTRKIQDEDDESSSSNSDQAFERLRQRASYYDISRLMSSNGLQSQLNKLRSGSANSITGKSRQRRPALLLEPETKEASRSATNNANYKSSIVISSSGADGTVRAKVSAAQLSSVKPSISQLDWSKEQIYSTATVSILGTSEHLEPSAKSSRISVVKTNDDSEIRVKKSEFDPRSLRGVPIKSRNFIEPEAVETDLGKQLEVIRHTTSIRLSKPEGDKNDKRNMAKPDINSQTSAENHELASPKDSSSYIDSSSSSKEEDDDEEESATEEGLVQPKSSALSKSGPFSLLRQSFNQKTLSSMLKFSGRASLRIKSSSTAPTIETSETADKASAIAIAEANLLAAKQLKQQAQKLMEQQKKEQSSLDPTTMMLAAVQYNQHIQRQQQQQQMIYQQAQQYAVAARGQMLDASNIMMQHQLMYQRHQQQQQMAHLASLNSAHYMAQQMTVMPSMVPMNTLPAQQLMYVPSPMPVQATQVQQSSGIFRKSILKSSSKSHAQTQMMYQQQQQQQPGQQLIPMAVNHHSSFNIVYSGSSSNSTTSQIPQMQTHLQHQQPNEEPSVQQSFSKQLGASMRKTVKSILINRSSFMSSSNEFDQVNSKTAGSYKLKSALKSPASRELNSEGSDGDGSSSDSTRNGTVRQNREFVAVVPKSALKKSNQSASSSEFSYASANSSSYHSSKDTSKLTMGQSRSSRQSVESNGKLVVSNQYKSVNSPTCSSRRKSMVAPGRKNVTFSTKLTSIS